MQFKFQRNQLPAVPKRRRKVILRRRLLRKGATGNGSQSSNKQSQTSIAGAYLFNHLFK